VVAEPSPHVLAVAAREIGRKRLEASGRFLGRSAREALESEEQDLASAARGRYAPAALEVLARIRRRGAQRFGVQSLACRQVLREAAGEAHLPVLQGEPDARPHVLRLDGAGVDGTLVG